MRNWVFGFGVWISLVSFSAMAQDTGSEPSGKALVLEVIATGGLSASLNEAYACEPGFPTAKVPTRDPISGKTYEQVIYGPIHESKNPFSNFSFWRNVTVYSRSYRREVISDLPALHQGCFDGGPYPIGNWQISRTLQVELRSSLKAGELGLGAEVSTSISEGRQFSMQRSLSVAQGIEADYHPQLRQEDWSGSTWIQTWEPSTRELGYIPPTVLDQTFDWYPHGFYLRNAETVFEVVRKNARKCKDGKGLDLESTLPDVVFPLQ